MLKLQLFGRARDLCMGISDANLQGDEGVGHIENAFYQLDALSVVSEVYQLFNELWKPKCGNNESVKAFESRFVSQVSKFNATSTTTKLPECLTTLIVLTKAESCDSQRVSVLAAASPSKFGNNGSNETF